MKSRAILQTFFSRVAILALNFGLVIYSTNVWGSEGRGVISLFTADLAFVLFLSNVFTGSSVSYFANKHSKSQVLFLGYIWSIIVGVFSGIIFSFIRDQNYFIFLTILVILSGFLSTNANLFVGIRKVKWFNVYTSLQVGFHLFFLITYVTLIGNKNLEIYFVSQITCFVVLVVISTFHVFKEIPFTKFTYDRKSIMKLFNYGWKTQLSAFLQFLNNRFSYYFLEFFKGVSSVGIYSIGVIISEAIWIVSRSLALVLYSDIINDRDRDKAIAQTKISMKMSFYLTLFLIIFILLIPSTIYPLVFGKDFKNVKLIITILSPGILAIAISNILGFYFAGIHQLRILTLKSLIGLLFTVLVSFYAIPKWGIVAACVISSLSYCISSIYLFWKFYQTTHFRINDFFISKEELVIFKSNIFKNK